MEKFQTIKSIIIPLNKANVDTDAIIPKQFLRSIKRSGFGVNLFDEWRYLDKGEVVLDGKQVNRLPNPDFVLNNPIYQGGKILLTRDNFGCGSSREHAPWALNDYGFRVIIAPSFADIFYNNCFNNAILPVVLKSNEIDTIFKAETKTVINDNSPLKAEINLKKQYILYGNKNQEQKFKFTIDNFRKEKLIQGLDDIDLTLKMRQDIINFEKKNKIKCPWLYS